MHRKIFRREDYPSGVAAIVFKGRVIHLDVKNFQFFLKNKNDALHNFQYMHTLAGKFSKDTSFGKKRVVMVEKGEMSDRFWSSLEKLESLQK